MDQQNHSLVGAEQVKQRQDLIRRALDLESNNPVPFLVAEYDMWFATQDKLEDAELDLGMQVAKYERQSLVDDYTVPHLKPGTGLGTIPAAFGCEWGLNMEADPWIKPLITGGNARDVYRLEMPDPRTSGKNGLFFDRVAYFQSRSALPLGACNIPAPLTAASMIWDYSSFLVALLDNPREVHHLLELVTEYTIAFLKQQIADIQRLWSLTHMNWYIPLEYGLRVSDDVLAVISPRQYEEFGVPYNSRLSREFGGIVVHSCGSITHNLPAILKTDGLRGITLTLPHNDILKVAELAAGKTALMLRYWNMDWENETPPNDLLGYTQQVLDKLGTRGILLEMQVPSATTEEAIALAQHIQSQAWRSS